MPDFHDQLRDAAARPTRDAPLAQIEQRLRTRRRTRIAAPVVATAVLVLGLGAGAAALARDDGARVTTAGSEGAASYGVTADLPAGWVRIPLVTTGDLRQVVAVGTTTVSSVDSCPVDHVSTVDAFVAVSEFSSGLPSDPELERHVAPRPADFATAPALTESACLGPTNGEELSRTSLYVFTEYGRAFTAMVVLGSNAPTVRRDEAYAILNSLSIEEGLPSPTAATTTSSSLVPTTTIVAPPTVPPSEDEQAVRAAFLGWIGTQPRDAAGAFVEDWESIKAAAMKAAAQAPLPVDGYTGRVEAVTEIRDDEATVIYSFLNYGQVAVANQQGRAVKIDGVWKVSRDTVCAALQIGNVQCPPRSG